MEYRKAKTSITPYILVVLLAVFCLFAIHKTVYAEKENNLIRVGVYELEGFHSFTDDGTCVGYDVDYLNRIANITGWDYEYVRADSWSSAINMLRNGEIDLLSPSQMTAERLEEFSFSTFPIGKVYAAILTLNDNQTVYEDYQEFDHMTFGIESGTTYAKIFKDYAESHDFSPNIKFYNNHATLVEDLRSGEVDAIVVNVMRAESDMCLLGKAGTAQFYYMYRKDDVELGASLNDALDQIEIDEPNFQHELVSAYFPIYNEEPFSKEELNYAKDLPTIKVACSKDARPYSYIDEKSGELTGIIIDYLNQAGECVGMNYEFVPFSGQVDDDYIQQNQIDLIVESGLSPIEKNRSKGNYSNNFLNTNQLIVCAPDVSYSIEKPLKIAWFGMNNIGNKLMQSNYSNFTWISYENAEECFEAVKKKEADGCMVNQFAANWYIAMPRYEDFLMISNSSISQSICLRAGADTQDTMFMKVVNKSFKQISDIEEQQIVIKYTTAMPYKLTFIEICYKYRGIIITAVMFMLLVVCFLIGYARNRSKSAKRDVMTGLYNRRFAMQAIAKQIRSKQYKAGALLMIDLDHFKEVNDTLGHQAGDRLLIETADDLTSSCRGCDIVCRLGGDEFLIYLACNKPENFLIGKLEQIRSKLEKQVTVNGETVNVSCSIGVALTPKDGKDCDTLYKCADEALYKVKENGRNGFAFYSDLN